MKTFDDLPATPAYMTEWQKRIFDNPTFAENLNKYQLTELKRFLNQSVLDEMKDLMRFNTANPHARHSSVTVEWTREVLAVVNARLLEVEHTETFTKKPRRKLTSSAGGKNKGENNWRKFQDFLKVSGITVEKMEGMPNELLADFLNKKGFKISKVTAGKYLKRLLKENPDK